MTAKRAVVAIGGNSLIKDSAHRTVEDQYLALAETDHHLANLVAEGWDLCITHGNGPQVGFILRRSELASHELHEVPLEVCSADTQGAIGYALQQNLGHDFRRLGIDRTAITVVTQVEVDPADPAFARPSKPIGSIMNRGQAEVRSEAYGWQVIEEVGRGWRRVVPSPRPVRIVEGDAIKFLLDSGYVVIAAGGGGIPVLPDDNGDLHGVAAVIDKDLTAALLAELVEADTLLISTAVDQVALHWGTRDQRFVSKLTLGEVKALLDERVHFGHGTMEPKMRAVVQFLEHGGQRAIITSPDLIERAMAGETGTRITPD